MECNFIDNSASESLISVVFSTCSDCDHTCNATLIDNCASITAGLILFGASTSAASIESSLSQSQV